MPGIARERAPGAGHRLGLGFHTGVVFQQAFPPHVRLQSERVSGSPEPVLKVHSRLAQANAGGRSRSDSLNLRLLRPHRQCSFRPVVRRSPKPLRGREPPFSPPAVFLCPEPPLFPHGLHRSLFRAAPWKGRFRQRPDAAAKKNRQIHNPVLSLRGRIPHRHVGHETGRAG